jgi:LmbE family N-acetylglucosaminyl deacetylase
VREPTPIRDDTFPMRGWGLPEPGETERVVVVSPHLDDAVLSCARFMAVHPGVHVVTVFAGNPPAYPEPMRLWDVQSGFEPGEDVMETRRAEDRAALAVLQAEPHHLDFIEHTYLPGDTPVAPDVVAPVLDECLRALQPTLVIAPFGLANPDHDVTHRACMLVRDELDASTEWRRYEEAKRAETPRPVSWWLYQDFGYHYIPGMLAWRTAQLFRRGVWPTPVCPEVDANDDRKLAAVECYPTQLHALDDDWRIREKLARHGTEQYWRIEAPPEGWERLSARE